MLIFLKFVRRKLYRNNALLRYWWFWLQFVKNNHYIPDFKRPKTYNEKINFRKNDPQNPLFSICADKIRVKKYVAERISPDIIIPSYYVGENITFEQMKATIREHGDCLLKANHNSGPVYLLSTDADDASILAAVKGVQQQLMVDFGKINNEPWYSDFKRGVLVEKRLQPQPGETDIRDYKFHVFNSGKGTSEVIASIDFNRNTNHSRSFFDEEFNWLNIALKKPAIVTTVTKPKNYGRMIEIVKRLAEPFSYARVDLYNVDDKVFFGEITFAQDAGKGHFPAYEYDLWMGNLWQGDPRR